MGCQTLSSSVFGQTLTTDPVWGLVGADKVWPTCIECQIEETDVGNHFLVGGVRGVQAEHLDEIRFPRG